MNTETIFFEISQSGVFPWNEKILHLSVSC